MPKSVSVRAAWMTFMQLLLFVVVFTAFFFLVSGFGWALVRLAHLQLSVPSSMVGVLTLFFLGLVFVLLPIFLVAILVKTLAKDIYKMYKENKDVCQSIDKEKL